MALQRPCCSSAIRDGRHCRAQHDSNVTAASSSPSPGEGQAPSTDSLAADWMTASKCPATPDRTNSVQDALGRLWGYDAELQGPCAFRAEDGASLQYAGYIQVKFDTAPACAGTLTSTNSIEDAQGALLTLHTALRHGPKTRLSSVLPQLPKSSPHRVGLQLTGRVLVVVCACRLPVGVPPP